MDKPKKYFYTLIARSGGYGVESEFLLPIGAKFIHDDAEYIVIDSNGISNLNCKRIYREQVECPLCYNLLTEIKGNDNIENDCLIGYKCKYCNYNLNF